MKHLPGVVLPLIVSSLPSFLWWVGEPPWSSALLESLVDGSDRMIVDIGEMTHIEASLTALEHLMLRKSARCAVSDTSWTAQSPWRDLVAQFFDIPAALPYLGAIERVTIDFAAGEEGRLRKQRPGLSFRRLAELHAWDGRASRLRPAASMPIASTPCATSMDGRLLWRSIHASA